MSRLDALFVIPMNVLDIKGGVPDAIEPPAKARFMLAYGERRKWSMDLFDANVLEWTPPRMAEEVRAANPYVVVLPVYGYNPSASTQTMPSAREFAEAIKAMSPEIPIMFTGTHPSAIPAYTLETEPAVDFVCGGEGPITIEDLLAATKAGGRLEDMRKVRSLWYRDNGGIGHGPEAPLIDLNQEPALPGWKYMDPRKYRPHHWHRFYQVTKEDEDENGRKVIRVIPEPYGNPYSVEGCPFHCSFCNIQPPYREGEEVLRQMGLLRPGVNSFRRLDPKLFVEEVTHLVEYYGVTFMKIPDEMFGLGEHPVKVAELIRDRFGDSLNFWCYYRIDTCKPQYLDLLRSAGFCWLGLGIEAANSTVRSRQAKKFSEDTIYDVVRRMHEAGIEGGLNYIFGLPGETVESMEATFKLACDLNGTYGNFYCTQALPGSELYREAKAKGYPLPERPGGPGWPGHAQYSEESEPYYDGDVLTTTQIVAFRDWAHAAYYKRPAYRERLLRDSKLGPMAIRNIDLWINHLQKSLKRNLLGGKTFWELPKGERMRLVPMSAYEKALP